MAHSSTEFPEMVAGLPCVVRLFTECDDVGDSLLRLVLKERGPRLETFIKN